MLGKMTSILGKLKILNLLKLLEKKILRAKDTNWSHEGLVATEIKTDPNHFWKYVRSKSKVTTSVSDLILPDGSTTKSDCFYQRVHQRKTG